MNTALSLMILTADYDGTVDECIDFGEEPSVDYQEIHQAGPDYRPYDDGDRLKQLDKLLMEQHYQYKEQQRLGQERWARRRFQMLMDEVAELRRLNAWYDEELEAHTQRVDVS